MTMPSWMQHADPSGPPPQVPSQAPGSMYDRNEEINQIATQAVLEQQEAEMRATMTQQRCVAILTWLTYCC